MENNVNYVSPKIEVIEFEVEVGFVNSGDGPPDILGSQRMENQYMQHMQQSDDSPKF